MNRMDRVAEYLARGAARRLSRRSFIGRIGAAITVAGTPLLPVARGIAATPATPAQPNEKGDPASCDYWRYCAIDGFLCSCCGGSASSCPPGSEPSPITWIGTCRNPADGKDYIISYNDCCGKTSCGACFCNRNEHDRPLYRPGTANDYNWCVGTKSLAYHCTVTLNLGVATKPT